MQEESRPVIALLAVDPRALGSAPSVKCARPAYSGTASALADSAMCGARALARHDVDTFNQECGQLFRHRPERQQPPRTDVEERARDLCLGIAA